VAVAVDGILPAAKRECGHSELDRAIGGGFRQRHEQIHHRESADRDPLLPVVQAMNRARTGLRAIRHMSRIAKFFEGIGPFDPHD
jgi:hypothetical protein